MKQLIVINYFLDETSLLSESLTSRYETIDPIHIDTDRLIYSLIEIFNSKEGNLYYLAKEMARVNFLTKSFEADKLPIEYIAIDVLKTNILNLKKYLLPYKFKLA